MHKRIKIILNWAISEHTAGPIVNCHVIWPKDDFVLNKPEFNTIINLQYNFTQACFKHNDDSELFSANETSYIKVKNFFMALGPVVIRLVQLKFRFLLIVSKSRHVWHHLAFICKKFWPDKSGAKTDPFTITFLSQNFEAVHRRLSVGSSTLNFDIVNWKALWLVKRRHMIWNIHNLKFLYSIQPRVPRANFIINF